MSLIKVSHKLTGEKFTVSKDCGNIIVCNLIKPYFLKGTRILIDKAVIRKENLIF
jgi:hypothetical protein